MRSAVNRIWKLFGGAFAALALAVPASAAPIALFDVDVSITAPFGVATGTATAELDDVGSLSIVGTAASTGGIFVSADATLLGTLIGTSLEVPPGGGGSSISLALISCTAAPTFCAIAESILPITTPLESVTPNPIVFDLGIGNETVLSFAGGVSGVSLEGTVTLTTTEVVPEPSVAALLLLASLALRRTR